MEHLRGASVRTISDDLIGRTKVPHRHSGCLIEKRIQSGDARGSRPLHDWGEPFFNSAPHRRFQVFAGNARQSARQFLYVGRTDIHGFHSPRMTLNDTITLPIRLLSVATLSVAIFEPATIRHDRASICRNYRRACPRRTAARRHQFRQFSFGAAPPRQPRRRWWEAAARGFGGACARACRAARCRYRLRRIRRRRKSGRCAQGRGRRLGHRLPRHRSGARRRYRLHRAICGDRGHICGAGDSALRTVADVDRPSVRVAVAQGSAYDLYLTRALRHATLVREPSGPEALDRFVRDRLEAAGGVRQPIVAFAATHPGIASFRAASC